MALGHVWPITKGVCCHENRQSPDRGPEVIYIAIAAQELGLGGVMLGATQPGDDVNHWAEEFDAALGSVEFEVLDLLWRQELLEPAQ